MTSFKIFEVGEEMPRYDENIFDADKPINAVKMYAREKYNVPYKLIIQRNVYGDGRIVVTNLKNGTSYLYDICREYSIK